MIDKEQPLDVCKIETKKQIDHRIEHDAMSTTKALRVVAEESGIPYNTLKQWFYPKSNENRKHKRRKEKIISIENGEKLPTTVGKPKLVKMTPVLQKILKQISIKELQDVVSKAVILSKGTGIGQSVKEVLDDIIEYYLYHVEQARLQRTEQK